MRVGDASTAQGRTRCPYADCREQLYIRISYEWADGQARLFADKFRLESLTALRERTQAPFAAGRFERTLGRWRDALPLSTLFTGGAVAMLWAIHLALPAADPVLPAVAVISAGAGFVVVSRHFSGLDVAERAAAHERSRRWAERLLAGRISADLEMVETTMSSATEIDGVVSGEFTVEPYTPQSGIPPV